MLNRREFQNFSTDSRRFKGQFIIVESKFSKHPDDVKLGITVTKRYGKSHERNQFKRKVREAFRLVRSKLPEGLLVHVKPILTAKEAKMQQIQYELLQACSESVV